MRLELPPGEASRQNNLENLTKELFGLSVYTTFNNNDLHFEAPPDKPFTKVQLITALNKFNDKKAHGPD